MCVCEREGEKGREGGRGREYFGAGRRSGEGSARGRVEKKREKIDVYEDGYIGKCKRNECGVCVHIYAWEGERETFLKN